MDIYNSHLLMDHSRFPANTGRLKNATHRADEINPYCGDMTTVEIQVIKNKLVKIKHHTVGCAVAIASASILSEKLTNRTTPDVLKMTSQGFLKLSGLKLTLGRIKCAMLFPLAIQKALLKS